MKTETFKRKDGSEGQTYSLEAGDEFTPKFDTPRETTRGEYTNYSLGVTNKDGKEMFIKLTKGQADKVKKLGQVKDKKLKAYAYTNDYGPQVSLELAEQE